MTHAWHPERSALCATSPHSHVTRSIVVDRVTCPFCTEVMPEAGASAYGVTNDAGVLRRAGGGLTGPESALSSLPACPCKRTDAPGQSERSTERRCLAPARLADGCYVNEREDHEPTADYREAADSLHNGLWCSENARRYPGSKVVRVTRALYKVTR